MGSFETVHPVPPVRLVLVHQQAIAESSAAIAPHPEYASIGNLRQQRIEPFLDLKDLAPRTRQTYAQQLK